MKFLLFCWSTWLSLMHFGRPYSLRTRKLAKKPNIYNDFFVYTIQKYFDYTPIVSRILCMSCVSMCSVCGTCHGCGFVVHLQMAFSWLTKEATDTLRHDHAQIPRLAPGLNVADPRVSLEIAQAGNGRDAHGFAPKNIYEVKQLRVLVWAYRF